MLSDLLALLAREAAPVEFERPLIAARQAGAPAADLAGLEEIKTAALRVRELLDRRRRRAEVIDYDGRRGTALLRTLEAYFAGGGSLARAAEVLHVHVNTVTQRLDRIAQLLGADWQVPELALRLHRLQGPLSA